MLTIIFRFFFIVKLPLSVYYSARCLIDFYFYVDVRSSNEFAQTQIETGWSSV